MKEMEKPQETIASVEPYFHSGIEERVASRLSEEGFEIKKNGYLKDSYCLPCKKRGFRISY